MAISDGEGRVAQKQGATEAGGPLSTIAPDTTSLVTAAALIGGVALLEPELMAGMVIGAGATILSGWIGGAFRPLLKAGVKAAYTAVEVVSHAAEEVQDLLAEARAEYEQEK